MCAKSSSCRLAFVQTEMERVQGVVDVTSPHYKGALETIAIEIELNCSLSFLAYSNFVVPYRPFSDCHGVWQRQKFRAKKTHCEGKPLAVIEPDHQHDCQQGRQARRESDPAGRFKNSAGTR